MRLLLLILAAAVSAVAQTPSYIAYKSTSLSGAAEKVTVQQVTGQNSKQVRFTGASIYCSVACTITLTQNSTAATATTLAITPVNLSPNSASAAFSSSNASGGTTLATYNIPAGGTMVLDLSNIYLSKNAPSTNNFSIGTNSITGTATIQINWQEQN